MRNDPEYRFKKPLTIVKTNAILKKAADGTESRFQFVPETIYDYGAGSGQRTWFDRPHGIFRSIKNLSLQIEFSLETAIEAPTTHIKGGSSKARFTKIVFSWFDLLQELNENRKLREYVSKLLKIIEASDKRPYHLAI